MTGFKTGLLFWLVLIGSLISLCGHAVIIKFTDGRALEIEEEVLLKMGFFQGKMNFEENPDNSIVIDEKEKVITYENLFAVVQILKNRRLDHDALMGMQFSPEHRPSFLAYLSSLLQAADMLLIPDDVISDAILNMINYDELILVERLTSTPIRKSYYVATRYPSAQDLLSSVWADNFHQVRKLKEEYNFTAKMLRDDRYRKWDIRTLLLAGFSIHELRNAGYQAKEDFDKASFSAWHLIYEGFDLSSIIGTYPLKDLQRLCVPLKNYQQKNISIDILKKLGFSANQLREAGESLKSLHKAFSMGELFRAGVSAVEMLAHFDEFSVSHAGYPLDELKAAGVKVSNLISAGFSTQSLLEAGFSNIEVARGNITRERLKETCVSPAMLREAGENPSTLARAGFSLAELKNAGYTARDLHSFGYSLKALKGVGFSIKDLGDAGFSVRDMRANGYLLQDLKAARCFKKDQIDAEEECSIL